MRIIHLMILILALAQCSQVILAGAPQEDDHDFAEFDFDEENDASKKI